MENSVSIPVRGMCKLWVDYGSSRGLVCIIGLCNEIVSLGRPAVMVLKITYCSDDSLAGQFLQNDEPVVIGSDNIKSVQVVASPLAVQEEHPELRPQEDPSLVVPISVSGPPAQA
jgi:hypothetical protein